MLSLSPLATFYSQTLGLQRNINQNQNRLDRTIERLNTGLRANRAADDPIGITQAKQVQTQQISNRLASSNTAQATLKLNISGLSVELLNQEGLSQFRSGDAKQIVDQTLEKTGKQTLGQLGVGLSILDRQRNPNKAEIGNLTKAQINVQVGAAILADNAANTRDLYDVLFDYNRDPQDLFQRFLQG
jgi:hypothetical protein